MEKAPRYTKVLTKDYLSHFLRLMGVETFVIIDDQEDHRIIVIIQLKKFWDKVKFFFPKYRKELYNSIKNELYAGMALSLYFCNNREGF